MILDGRPHQRAGSQSRRLHPVLRHRRHATGRRDQQRRGGLRETSAGTNSARAYLWLPIGSTNTPSSIHPSGYLNSFATGIYATNVVGYGTATNGGQVALLWHGLSATNVVNLSTSLPSGASNAVATAIDYAGNISGYATVGSQTHAIVWQPAIRAHHHQRRPEHHHHRRHPLFLRRHGHGPALPRVSLSNTPPGIALSPTGTFSGAPASAGIYNCTLFATNGISPSASQNFALTVNPTPVQSYAIQHKFFDGTVPNDGLQPNAGLLPASDGNFYGMTPFGGSGPNLSGYSQTEAAPFSRFHRREPTPSSTISATAAFPTTAPCRQARSFKARTETSTA